MTKERDEARAEAAILLQSIESATSLVESVDAKSALVASFRSSINQRLPLAQGLLKELAAAQQQLAEVSKERDGADAMVRGFKSLCKDQEKVLVNYEQQLAQRDAEVASMREGLNAAKSYIGALVGNWKTDLEFHQAFAAVCRALSSTAGSDLLARLTRLERIESTAKEVSRYLHTISDDRAVGFSAPMPVDVLEDFHRALIAREAIADGKTNG